MSIGTACVTSCVTLRFVSCWDDPPSLLLSFPLFVLVRQLPLFPPQVAPKISAAEKRYCAARVKKFACLVYSFETVVRELLIVFFGGSNTLTKNFCQSYPRKKLHAHSTQRMIHQGLEYWKAYVHGRTKRPFINDCEELELTT